MLFKVKISHSIIIGACLALLFRNLGFDKVQVINREGLLFFITMDAGMMGCVSNCVTFPIERPLMLKDYKEKLYGVVPYYFSKMIAELPAIFIFCLIYSLIVYFAAKLNTESAGHFFAFYGIICLVHLAGIGVGNLAGAISTSPAAANTFGPTLAAPLVLFGGFFSKSSSLALAFGWVKYISLFSLGYQSFVLNDFDGLPFDQSEFPSGGPVEELGFTGELWQKVGSLLLIFLGYVVLALVALKIVAESQVAK